VRLQPHGIHPASPSNWRLQFVWPQEWQDLPPVADLRQDVASLPYKPLDNDWALCGIIDQLIWRLHRHDLRLRRAQAIRAILLAKAIAATFVGRLAIRSSSLAGLLYRLLPLPFRPEAVPGLSFAILLACPCESGRLADLDLVKRARRGTAR